MTSGEFCQRLKRRAKRVGADVPAATQEALEAYYRLLARWNARINLTGLPLDEPSDETFDRLLVEPLAAVRHVPERNQIGVRHVPDWGQIGVRYVPELGHRVWFDLGSGGGSPAIPMKILRPDLELTMVESKARKAAFLREAIRTLQLQAATVQHMRFEELAGPKFDGAARLITVRAVRADEDLFNTASRLLSSGGHLLLFHSDEVFSFQPSFTHIDTVQISDAQPHPARLSKFRRA